FGLPAACLAMLHTARPERRKAVGGMLTSLALTSFLTGVTEPIEFSFMFLAPLLYAVHAVLTGLSMVIMNLLDVKLGFGFSAGLFDYVLNFNKATRPLLLIPVGLAYAGVYYVVFRWVIIRFDLKTPGREPDEAITIAVKAAAGGRGEDFLTALGGAANLASVDACTTRLRLIVTGEGQVDEPRLKALGARGIVRPSERALQVVLGPIADQVAGEIRAAMGGASVARSATVPEPQPAVEAGDRVMAERLVAALGGSRNIETLGSCTSRLRVVVLDPLAIDEAALKTLGARGVARIGERTIHVVMGPQADALAEAIRLLPA
ncbi:PTS N-acetyl-D-glucosamine transporter, partial [Pseudomonas sp. HMWF010]